VGPDGTEQIQVAALAGGPARTIAEIRFSGLNNPFDISRDGALIVDEYMQTSVPGVFGAGDVRGKEIKQAVVAASDGCVAAVVAEKYIRKRTRVVSQY